MLTSPLARALSESLACVGAEVPISHSASSKKPLDEPSIDQMLQLRGQCSSLVAGGHQSVIIYMWILEAEMIDPSVP